MFVQEIEKPAARRAFSRGNGITHCMIVPGDRQGLIG
jgi:hypothetical protein